MAIFTIRMFFTDKGWLFTFCTILPTKGGNIQVCTFYFVWQGVWNCGNIHHSYVFTDKGWLFTFCMILPTKGGSITDKG